MRPIPFLAPAILTSIVGCSDPAAPPVVPPRLVAQWGSEGAQLASDPGAFYSPRGIAVNTAGDVYVADMDGDIQKFDADGRFLLSFSFRREGLPLGIPVGLGTDANNNVYLAQDATSWSPEQSGLGHIQKFDAAGDFVSTWEFGPGPGHSLQVLNMAVDASGNTYVGDLYHRIRKFGPDGRFLFQWGYAGLEDDAFGQVTALAIDGAGNVVVADDWRKRIQVFDAAGRFLSKRNLGGWHGTRGIAVAPAGDIYVADDIFDRILRFDSTCRLLQTWGQAGRGDSEFDGPMRIALSPAGDFIYVLDVGNHRVQKFAR